MSTVEIKLPEIGEGVTEGEMVQWLVQVGDSVEPDQPVAEIMTDKATVEVPSPIAGKVTKLVAQEGDVIVVEGVMLELDTDGAAATTSKAVADAPAPVAAAPAGPSNGAGANGSNGAVEIHPPAAESSVLASPSTRRYARETNVDINVLQGTGLAGRVTRDDVAGAGTGTSSPSTGSVAAPSPMSFPKTAYKGPEGAAEERVPLRGIRKKIAENMQMAKHVIPHFTIMDEANVDELIKVRTRLKPVAAARQGKITYLPFVIKALCATVREFPEANASIDDAAQEIVYKKYMNIGFAADTPNGLLVPVIKNADTKTLYELGQEVVGLGYKARDGKLTLDEMRGATVTITNIGAIGGNYATPIINHPEVAILGMYKINRVAYEKDNGEVGFKSTMNFTMTCDHRLIDGAVAARFLSAFIKRIEDPGVLMLDMI